MRVAFDFDQTLCLDSAFGPPNAAALAQCRAAFDAGHTVLIYTARPEDDRHKVESWLAVCEVRYDALRMGKLRYDVLVDDRAVPWPGLLTPVAEFNQHAGGPTTWPDGIRLRASLVREETNELLEALEALEAAPEDDNLKEHVLKEALDVMYVTLGVFMLEGWDERKLLEQFAWLHRDNMRRFRHGIHKNAEGKAIRPEKVDE